MQTSTQVAETSVQTIKTTDTTKKGYPIRNVEWNKDGILGYYGELLEDGRWRVFMWDKDGKSGNPKYDLDTLPDATPTRWLCRLGPWQMEFSPGQEGEVVDWCQEKTQYWALWSDGEFKEHRRILKNWVRGGNSVDSNLFGRRIMISPLPLKPARVQVKLPRFYEWADMGTWTDVETDLILEDGNGSHVVTFTDDFSYVSVFLRLEAGGRYCVADLATREQANSLAAILMSGATWFVPAK